MKKTLTQTLCALVVGIALVITACNKQVSTSEDEKLPALTRNDLSNSPSGITGISGCYHTFSENVKNPPAGSLPGDAQIELAECMRQYINLGHPGSNIKYLPPPEPTPGTRIYPPAPNQDGVLLTLLGLEGYRLPSFYVNNPNYPEIVQKFEVAKLRLRRIADILCSTVAAAEAFLGGLSSDPATRRDQIVYYIMLHPQEFPSDSPDYRDALKLAAEIGSYEKFTISFALAAQFEINSVPLFPPPGFVRFPAGCIGIRVAPAVLNY